MVLIGQVKGFGFGVVKKNNTKHKLKNGKYGIKHLQEIIFINLIIFIESYKKNMDDKIRSN